MLRDIDQDLKLNFNSDDDDLLEDLLVPLLKQSITYDRAVGYFSADIFKIAAEGLSVFVKNKGKIRLIVGNFINIKDYDALNIKPKEKDIFKKTDEELIEYFETISDDLHNFRIDCLSWLVANNQLEIKVAFKRNGIFHAKYGILKDQNNSRVVYSGSGNDTFGAFELNYEEFNVFRSWNEEGTRRCNDYQRRFEDLWENRNIKTEVWPLSKAPRDYLIKRAEKINPENLIPEREINYNRLFLKSSKKNIKPTKPAGLELYQHQKDALNEWKNNGKWRGIFELATGTGKTITSIWGALKISERQNLCLIVSVPKLNLADQWCEDLRLFNMVPIKCYETFRNWEEILEDKIAKFNLGTLEFLPIVVVNATMSSERYQRLIDQISPDRNIMIIGDECHHHSSVKYNDSLPKQAKFRIGLSATPEDIFNDDKNERLKSYYGNIVAKFTLEEAIRKKILCPYEYQVVLVSLTLDEQEEYRDISKEISRLYSITGDMNNINPALLSRRSRLLGNAQNKITELEKLLQSKKPEPYTLFYCGEGSHPLESEIDNDEEIESLRQIEAVTSLMHAYNWKSSKYTSRETKNIRKDIMEVFKDGSIDALVAMKCLDEGIDIPLCKTAYLIASTNNPRQYIQRSGRILRKHPDKKQAKIIDFVVEAPMYDGSNIHDKRLIQKELKRVKSFTDLSLNADETYEQIRPLLIKYGIEEEI